MNLYDKLEELKKHLNRGDGVLLAGMVGCSNRMAQKVLNGDANPTSPFGKKIVNQAEKLIESRFINKGSNPT